MKTEDFDKIFDDGEDSVIPYLDMASIRRPNRESVSITFPTWMIIQLIGNRHDQVLHGNP